MTTNVKLLEELVVEAVDRLRALTRERGELREEVGALRKRLDAQEREGRSGRSPEESRGLETRHERAREVLVEALSELRGEGNAA